MQLSVALLSFIINCLALPIFITTFGNKYTLQPFRGLTVYAISSLQYCLMKANSLIAICMALLLSTIALHATDRTIVRYEALHVKPSMTLEVARVAPVVDMSHAEIVEPAFIKHDWEADTAFHETVFKTRRDYRTIGDSLWLYRQEWHDRYFHLDSMAMVSTDSASMPVSARMRRHIYSHTMAKGHLDISTGNPVALIVAEGDTLAGVATKTYCLDSWMVHTDYTYTELDTIAYPMRYEVTYWYAPGLPHPSMVWERFSNILPGHELVIYDNTYVVPTFENRDATDKLAPKARTTAQRFAQLTAPRQAPDGEGLIQLPGASVAAFAAVPPFEAAVTVASDRSSINIEPIAADGFSTLLCDVAGRVYCNRPDATDIDISMLPPGEYLLTLWNDTSASTHKFRIP